jgi:hypothetical protein
MPQLLIGLTRANRMINTPNTASLPVWKMQAIALAFDALVFFASTIPINAIIPAALAHSILENKIFVRVLCQCFSGSAFAAAAGKSTH